VLKKSLQKPQGQGEAVNQMTKNDTMILQNTTQKIRD